MRRTYMQSRRGLGRRGNTLTVVLGGLGLFVGGALVGLIVANSRGSASPDEGGGASAGDGAVPGAVSEQPAVTPSGPDPTLPAPNRTSTEGSTLNLVPNPPPIQFEPPLLDLGFLDPGEVATGSVEIVNIGTEPLRIVSTKASCKCTSIDLADSVIEPGQSIALSTEYEGSKSLGEKKSSIRVIVEGYDPVHVDVKAEVAMVVRAVPSYIRALAGPDGTIQLQGEMRIEAMDGLPFNILSVDQKMPRFVDFEAGVDAPRTSYTIEWDLTEYDQATCVDQYGREMAPWLVVETDHPDVPIFDIQIRHQCTRTPLPVRGQTWVLGQRNVLLGEVRAGEPIDVQVVVKMLNIATRDEPIRAIIPLTDEFEAEIIDRFPGDRETTYVVRITPREDYRGLLLAQAEFRTVRHGSPLYVIGKVVE